MSFVLAIDQGTTSSRAIVFRSDISIAATAQQEFPQHFPASGWVEHEPEDIWTSTVRVCCEALEKADVSAKDIAAIKEQVGVSAVEAANDALDRLERHDPAQYHNLLRERRSAK